MKIIKLLELLICYSHMRRVFFCLYGGVEIIRERIVPIALLATVHHWLGGSRKLFVF